MKKKNQILLSIVLFISFIVCVLILSEIFMKIRYISENEVEEIVFLNSGSTREDVHDYVCEKFIYEKENERYVSYNVSYSDSKGVYSFIVHCESGKILDCKKIIYGESIPEINQP